MPETAIAPGIRTVRVPDGTAGRIDRFIADATGLSRSHVQKLISDGRLTVDGVPATWDTALDRMVNTFRALIDEHGPGSVAVLSTGQLVTEEFYALGKLVRLGMGIEHFDGNTTLCMASAVSGYRMSFGTDGPPGSYEDFELADVVVLWGANVADNHPLLAPRLLGGDRRLVVVDPRVTKTAMLADVHLPVRPRGDVVEILCEDEGPGFPPEDVDRVFERFYSRRPPGEAFGLHSGLGLSISRQIVDAHGGTIRAENRLDPLGRIAGARVIVTLPLASAARG